MHKTINLEISDITIKIHSNESDTVCIITEVTDLEKDVITGYTDITLTIDQAKEFIKALQGSI